MHILSISANSLCLPADEQKECKSLESKERDPPDEQQRKKNDHVPYYADHVVLLAEIQYIFSNIAIGTPGFSHNFAIPNNLPVLLLPINAYYFLY